MTGSRLVRYLWHHPLGGKWFTTSASCDLHLLVRKGGKARFRLNNVIIEKKQGAKLNVFRIKMAGKREEPVDSQPVDGLEVAVF